MARMLVRAGTARGRTQLSAEEAPDDSAPQPRRHARHSAGLQLERGPKGGDGKEREWLKVNIGWSARADLPPSQ